MLSIKNGNANTKNKETQCRIFQTKRLKINENLYENEINT